MGRKSGGCFGRKKYCAVMEQTNPTTAKSTKIRIAAKYIPVPISDSHLYDAFVSRGNQKLKQRFQGL